MSSGILYIVATPIGNLKDITFRAVDTLKSVELILAEDTRHCQTLLKAYQITTTVRSYHEHTTYDQVKNYISMLTAGNNLALISDAGTPLISDPGYRIVSFARENKIKVEAIPGTSAVMASLSVVGFPTDSFCFDGFLPHKLNAKQEKLRTLEKETRTCVLFESARRLIDTLKLMQEVFDKNRKIAVVKELTKMYENVWIGSPTELIKLLQSTPEVIKGEICILIKGKQSKQEVEFNADAERWLNLIAKELSPSKVAQIGAKALSLPKADVYKWLEKMKQKF